MFLLDGFDESSLGVDPTLTSVVGCRMLGRVATMAMMMQLHYCKQKKKRYCWKKPMRVEPSLLPC